MLPVANVVPDDGVIAFAAYLRPQDRDRLHQPAHVLPLVEREEDPVGDFDVVWRTA